MYVAVVVLLRPNAGHIVGRQVDEVTNSSSSNSSSTQRQQHSEHHVCQVIRKLRPTILQVRHSGHLDDLSDLPPPAITDSATQHNGPIETGGTVTSQCSRVKTTLGKVALLQQQLYDEKATNRKCVNCQQCDDTQNNRNANQKHNSDDDCRSTAGKN